MTKANTKQMEQQRDEKGRIVGGTPPAGFNKYPENRHNGAWKKEDTLRFQIETVAKMDDGELSIVIEDTSRPRLVRNFATAVQKSQWREIREIIEMIYGKPKESIDVSSPDGSMTPTVRIIDERRDTNTE